MFRIKMICCCLLSVLCTAIHSQRNKGTIIPSNPIIPDFVADPSLVMFNDTFYLYGTTDIDKGLREMGPPVVWKSTDFVNWHFEGALQISPAIDWGKPYNYTDDKGQAKTGYFRYWAPGNVIKRDNNYILYVTIVKPNEKMGTYALVADQPAGPFHFSNGSGLHFGDSAASVMDSKPVVDDIDGDPFVDDDGNGYIYWRRRLATALKDDLLSAQADKITIPTRHQGYSEGPGLFKRKGIYYYFYTLSGNASYCNGYMMSKHGPLGPFDTPAGKNIFIFSDTAANVWGPGHGNIFRMPGKDEYYFLYLEYGEGSTTRQVFANRIYFNADGTIQPVKVNRQGVGNLSKARATIKKNLALGSLVTASSFRPERPVLAEIAPDPDLVLVAPADAKPKGVKVRRTFSYVAGNAADGSNGSRWMAANGDMEPWVQFDLGKATKVQSLEVFFVFPVYGHAFILEKSSEGKTWVPCFDQQQPAVRSPHTVTSIGNARYLRLKISKGAPGIWECRIY